MMNAVFGDYDDVDGNFIEQFRTTGFDARTYSRLCFVGEGIRRSGLIRLRVPAGESQWALTDMALSGMY